MTSPKLEVEKFIGENDFHLWRLKMKALLVHQGLDEALAEVTSPKKPRKISEDDLPDVLDRGHCAIILSLGDGVLREVGGQTTAVGLWKKLEDLYTKKSMAKSHKEGHFKKDCPERKYKSKEAKEKTGDAAVVSEGQESDGYDSAGVFIVSDGASKGNWVLDSGCSFHMCPNKAFFKSYETYDGGIIVIGNDASCRVIGRGTIKLKMLDGTIRELANVRHVPDLKRNLISLGMLDKMGCVIKLESGTLKVLKGSMVLMKGNLDNGLYVLQGSVVTGDVGVSNQNLNKTLLWHFRLGHMSERGLRELSKQEVLGEDKIEPLEFCEECVLGKSSRVKFSTGAHVSRGTLEYIHADLWGPAQTASLGGARYFLSLIDDHSRMVWVYVLKNKDEVFERFKNWKTLIETQTNRKVKKPRTDNGLEFCNKRFKEFCSKHGVMRHRTLPMSLWAEALSIACHIVNRSPLTGIHFKTPYELWYSKPANYSNLKIFGCLAYAHIKQGKLEPRALKCVFLGYPEGVKGYKLWCTDMKPLKAIISRDVVFNEAEMLQHSASLKTTNAELKDKDERSYLEVELSNSNQKQKSRSEAEDIADMEIHDTENETASDQRRSEDYQLVRDKENRVIKPPRRYAYADLITFALTAAHEIATDEPRTYSEAINSNKVKEWIKAIDEEMMSLKKNHTWNLIERPTNKRVVGCKRIYKIKEGIPDVEPQRYKARLVAKGFTQKEGVDFTEVFSPMVRHASLRILLSLVAVQGMHLEQMDVKTAFLHGEIDEMIVMSQPEGYEDPEKADHGGDKIYLLLYIDDMLIACKEMEFINELKQQLSNTFEMKDLGAAKKILGVQLNRDRKNGILSLTHHKYIRKVLEKFNMDKCKPVQTPLPSHFRLSCQQCPNSDAEKAEMNKFPYSSAVGCLMYAMVLTRPDLSHAVSVVSRYMANPEKDHWRAVVWILRYLAGTTGYGLIYGAEKYAEVSVEGYVDADYVGDLDKRRSLTGFLFMLNGCTINWKASLQSVVAPSTTEAEYTTAAEAIKEAIWLRGMVTELGFEQKQITVHCDSQSAICLSKNQIHHEKNQAY
ncbi:hypothetical protein KPL71_026750 [Citrus sinensis]|uniref:Uncharacterized protein n=1 Tax=Citrus sinensis TaxID=2711 RepID=A0ACB8I1R2_CITSI|nr:hypothetical protein KPL71_026750 [Citrus sinensis]